MAREQAKAIFKQIIKFKYLSLIKPVVKQLVSQTMTLFQSSSLQNRVNLNWNNSKLEVTSIAT